MGNFIKEAIQRGSHIWCSEHYSSFVFGILNETHKEWLKWKDRGYQITGEDVEWVEVSYTAITLENAKQIYICMYVYGTWVAQSLNICLQLRS